MRAAFLISSLLVVAFAAGAPAQQAPVWRVFPIPHGGGGDLSLSSSPPLREAYSPDIVESVEWFSPNPAGLIADLVRTTVAPQSWDLPGHRIDVDDGRIVAINQPQVLDETGRLIAFLQSRLEQRAIVEIWRLETMPAAATATLDAAATEALVTGGGAERLAIFEARDAKPRSFGTPATRQFVSRWNVEIAEKAAIADPAVSRLRTGLDGFVTVRAASRGRHGVVLSLRDSTLVDMTLAPVATTTSGMIELPTVESALITSQALLSDGGGMIVAARSGTIGGVLLVRVRSAVAAEQSSWPNLALLPVTSEIGQESEPRPIYVGGSPREREVALPLMQRRNFSTFDQISDVTVGMMGPGFYDGPGNFVMSLPPFLVIRDADATRLGRARDLLARMDDALATPLRVELRLMLGEGESTPFATLSLSVLDGQPAQALVGRERAYVGEYEVEVATKSSIAAGEPDVAFHGVVIGVVATLIGENRVSLRMHGLARRELESPEGMALGYLPETDATLERGSWIDARLTASGVVTPGEWTTLQSGGVGGAATSLEARVIR